MNALPACFKLLTLHLDVAGKQTRLGVDPAFRLQRHDFLRDFLSVVGLCAPILAAPKASMAFAFAAGSLAVWRNFCSDASASAGLIELHLRVAEIKPKVRFHAADIGGFCSAR